MSQGGYEKILSGRPAERHLRGREKNSGGFGESTVPIENQEKRNQLSVRKGKRRGGGEELSSAIWLKTP